MNKPLPDKLQMGCTFFPSRGIVQEVVTKRKWTNQDRRGFAIRL